MREITGSNIVENIEYRGKKWVFRDRFHAGEMLASMLEEFADEKSFVFAIPAGGVPVAVRVAEVLKLPLEVMVVSKITLPWNTEAGYGAVAFDGTLLLNDALVRHFRLTEKMIQAGAQETIQKVMRRVKRFRGDRSFPNMAGHTAILIDDGLASGFTMLTAVEALRKKEVSTLVVAVPTASVHAIERVSPYVERLYCVNVRGDWSFAVADAYMAWSDVNEDEAVQLFRKYCEMYEE